MVPSTRFAQMGKFAKMLEHTKKKINSNFPNRHWDYIPIMNFKFNRHAFNKTEEPTQGTNEQQTVHAQSPVRSNTSNSQEYDDDDCLIIEPEENSFVESGSEDSDDDLQSSVAQVDSINQILKDVCTELHCINNNLSAQCNDPVHNPQLFEPHAISTPNRVQQHPSPMANIQANIQPQFVQPAIPQIQAAMQPYVAQPALQPQPTKQPFIFDFVNMEAWFLVDPEYHTMLGGNKLKIRANCPITNLPLERVATVKYRSHKKEYFQIAKHLKADDVWLANTASFSAISASLGMNPSTSQLLSETNYLDSYIGEDSGLRKALQELMKLSPDLTRLLVSSSLEKTITHFEENCKLFSIHSFINFTAGFELTSKSFDRFLQDKPLSVFNFEKQVGAQHGIFVINTDLNSTERRTRKHLLHTISTVHMMEEFVGNIEKVEESERERAKIHLKTGQAINKRMLANVEIDTLHWMKAKMDIRLSLLTNMQNVHAQEIAASSLWDPDVFPEEAMARITTIANNKSRSVMSLLGIQGNKPRKSSNGQHQVQQASSAHASQEPPNKRFKHNNQPSTSNSQPHQVYHTKRGTRGGKRYNKNKHINNNNGKGKQLQGKPRNNKGNNKGNSFHKKGGSNK